MESRHNLTLMVNAESAQETTGTNDASGRETICSSEARGQIVAPGHVRLNSGESWLSI